MVVDSSAILAILMKERDGPGFAGKIATARIRIMSSVSRVETGIVGAARKGGSGGADVAQLLETLGVTVVDFTAGQVAPALDAWRRYGKGNHPARLNFADCCVYALCKATGEPLLFKGEDFSQTDLELVR